MTTTKATTTSRRLFVNGRIWQWAEDVNTDAADALSTEGPQQQRGPWASWLLVDADEGVILDIGTGPAPAAATAGAATTADKVAADDLEIVDLAGALVLPGLHDAHIHAYYMGESAEFLNLTGCRSFEDLTARLGAYDARYPDKSWIVGFGWEQDQLSPGARYPSRQDLDAVVSTRPVVLHRACWHIAVANTRALELAGLDVTRPPPPVDAGTIDVDADGRPTGILREAAVEIVTKHTNEESDAIRLQYITSALDRCVSQGLTGIQTNDHNAWHLYGQIQRERGLPLRVYYTPRIGELGQDATPPAGAKDGKLLSCDRIKIFSDGSLGAETAALRTPYRGTENRGILMDSDESLVAKIRDAHAAGYRLEIHAIGDRAAEQVLRGLRDAGVTPNDRPLLTHCQLLGPDLLDAMRDQGVIGNIQPSFTITDASFARKRLPEEVIPYSYCWRTMLAHGIVCAGGSDAPIETSNPFQGIYDAIYRRRPGASESETYLPEERLTFDAALRLYTVHGAFAAREEHRLGRLRRGFRADFVVLGRDVTVDHAALLDKALVRSVWVDGRETFARKDDQANDDKEGATGDFSHSSLPGKNGPEVRICRCCCR